MPKNRRAIASRQHKLARTAASWLLLFAILTTTVIPSSVKAQDERVTVRLDGRSVFRVSAVENTDAEARARQIERRMKRLLEKSSENYIFCSRRSQLPRSCYPSYKYPNRR